MKANYLVIPLLILPFYAFSQTETNFLSQTITPNPDINTQITTYTDEGKYYNYQLVTRSIDYPTQIIRMESDIENQQITCEEVHNQLDKILVKPIANELFTYSIYISCRYNPETKLAIQLKINSYFDPLSDDAITYLESYLKKYNGTDILGTQYKIESAKGLIISLNIAAGMKKKPTCPPFIQYRADRSNYYFKNNYEMKSKLFSDMFQNFFTPDPEKILPFLDKWISFQASSIYKSVLIDSNYVELQPEKIFLMDNDDIFVSILKQYFIHFCEQYKNHRCLTPT